MMNCYSDESSTLCQWFTQIGLKYKINLFNNDELVLYTKYIREKKLNTLIDEESQETTDEIQDY